MDFAAGMLKEEMKDKRRDDDFKDNFLPSLPNCEEDQLARLYVVHPKFAEGRDKRR
jgi:hypothetical protein